MIDKTSSLSRGPFRIEKSRSQLKRECSEHNSERTYTIHWTRQEKSLFIKPNKKFQECSFLVASVFRRKGRCTSPAISLLVSQKIRSVNKHGCARSISGSAAKRNHDSHHIFFLLIYLFIRVTQGNQDAVICFLTKPNTVYYAMQLIQYIGENYGTTYPLK